MRINAAVQKKLDEITANHQDISNKMATEDVIENHSLYQNLAKDFAQISPIVTAYEKLKDIKNQISDLEQVKEDDEMQELIQEELLLLQEALVEKEQEVCFLLLPKDPDDSCNAFVEIRAGTGGLEAALFAADLSRMYTRYAEIKNWKTKVVSCHESESGGFKEVILHITGKAVYEVLKYESGAHRVQRVPMTESQGRVHTSACTVAVMPEIKIAETINIDPNDLRIDTYRASGAGGQHVNKTDSAVRITHLPTNTVVECQDERSQHKNKAKALNLLQTKIISAQRAEQKAKQAKERKTLVGSGDRSERIRTYNFPQGRMTDHRINLTLYSLSDIMEGSLDQIVIQLRQQDQLDQMAHFN